MMLPRNLKQDDDPQVMCGNRVIQGDEECDCGVPVPFSLLRELEGNLQSVADSRGSWTEEEKEVWKELVEKCHLHDPCCTVLVLCQHFGCAFLLMGVLIGSDVLLSH
jgi:hypothetical protein